MLDCWLDETILQMALSLIRGGRRGFEGEDGNM